MSTGAIALLLLSACLHTTWNLLGKRRSPSLCFFLIAIGSNSLLLLPAVLLLTPPVGLPRAFWLWLALSGLSQSLYLGGLAWAYARGNMSVLYPIIRATPLLILPLLALVIAGLPAVTTDDMFNIGLVALGALCLPLANRASLRLSTYLDPALAFALLAALGTVGYALADKQALDLMTASGHSHLTAGLSFMVLQGLVTLLWGMLLVLMLPGERARLQPLLRARKGGILLTGTMMNGTYGLVLVAMAMTADLSHVVAMRQLSIPLGFLVGVFLLKERAAPIQWLAVAVMLTGLYRLA